MGGGGGAFAILKHAGYLSNLFFNSNDGVLLTFIALTFTNTSGSRETCQPLCPRNSGDDLSSGTMLGSSYFPGGSLLRKCLTLCPDAQLSPVTRSLPASFQSSFTCSLVPLLRLLRAFMLAHRQELPATLRVCGLQDRSITDPSGESAQPGLFIHTETLPPSLSFPQVLNHFAKFSQCLRA